MQTSAASPRRARPASTGVLRVGGVSFLNAKPLLYGLESQEGVSLSLDVPSRLLDGLVGGRLDVALLPVIDYQRLPGLRLMTAGGIGCDGATLTVRIFSRVPTNRISALACDPDSHTSVALARILLAERFNVMPAFLDLRDADDAPGTARLLIGDKVVRDEPAGFPHQVDLGEAWKAQTGLPFVFAAWMARAEVDLGDLPQILDRARREGLRHVDEIVARHAGPLGWPEGVARKYLTEYLHFEIGARQTEAIRTFHALAAKHGIIPSPPEPLVIEA